MGSERNAEGNQRGRSNYCGQLIVYENAAHWVLEPKMFPLCSKLTKFILLESSCSLDPRMAHQQQAPETELRNSK